MTDQEWKLFFEGLYRYDMMLVQSPSTPNAVRIAKNNFVVKWTKDKPIEEVRRMWEFASVDMIKFEGKLDELAKQQGVPFIEFDPMAE